MRNATFVGTTTLVTEECCRCGMVFAMTKDFEQRCRDNPYVGKFYCPAGHRQWYTGETEEAKLEKKLSAAQEEVNREQWKTLEAQESRDRARKQRNALKGHLKRTKQRIAVGVCPCCNRTFVNLGKHMHGQHPRYAK